MTITYRNHFYKRGFWVRWNAGGQLRFAYVGRHLIVNRNYFFNV